MTNKFLVDNKLTLSEAIKKYGYTKYLEISKSYNESQRFNSNVLNNLNKFVVARLKHKSHGEIKVNKLGEIISASGKLLKGKIAGTGMDSIRKIEYMTTKNVIFCESIPRIVWRTFNGEIPDNFYVIPIKNLLVDPYNLHNLRCVDPSTFMKEKKQIKKYDIKSHKTCFVNKLTKTDLILLNDILFISKIDDLCIKYNVSRSAISNLKKRVKENKINLLKL